MFSIVQGSLFDYFGLVISQIRFHKLIINYYLIIYKNIIHKYICYYLVRFGSFFIIVPSTVQGDFQYSVSFISRELIRISNSVITAQPQNKLIAIKLINITIYFILFYSYIPKNNISCISLFIWFVTLPLYRNSNTTQTNTNNKTKISELTILTSIELYFGFNFKNLIIWFIFYLYKLDSPIFNIN
jgi:hypothetical protein